MQTPLKIEDLLNFLYLIYCFIRGAIQWLLENTIFEANPSLATQFADAVTLLITLTSIFLILELISGMKKVLAIIIVLGWTFLVISMAITLLV
jgi:hypothetical protein